MENDPSVMLCTNSSPITQIYPKLQVFYMFEVFRMSSVEVYTDI